MKSANDELLEVVDSVIKANRARVCEILESIQLVNRQIESRPEADKTAVKYIRKLFNQEMYEMLDNCQDDFLED